MNKEKSVEMRVEFDCTCRDKNLGLHDLSCPPKTKEGESYIVILMDWLNDVHDFLESLEKESE